MTLDQFRATLKKFSFIDRQAWMSDRQWVEFSFDPVRFFMRADDETAERLWEMIRPKEEKV